MTITRLQELFDKFSTLRITVAGDLFLDRWYEVDPALNEPSVETGLTAYQVVKKRAAAGAAGTVLNNLCAMQVGKLRVVSLLGDDGDGWETLKLLRDKNVDVEGVIVSGEIVTPSYIKALFPQEGNRLDIKNFKPTPLALQDQLIVNIEEALKDSDALILLDQVCEADTGVLTAHVRQAVCTMAGKYPDKLIWADSRAFIHHFSDVTIKCNQLEAARMTGREADENHFDLEMVFACMDDLHAKTGKSVVVTCGARGVAVEAGQDKRLVPAVRQEGEIDICGAGDACSAGMVPALCAGGSFTEAAIVGNLSSGVTVRKLGQTGTASREEMLALYREQWGNN